MVVFMLKGTMCLGIACDIVPFSINAFILFTGLSGCVYESGNFGSRITDQRSAKAVRQKSDRAKTAHEGPAISQYTDVATWKIRDLQEPPSPEAASLCTSVHAMPSEKQPICTGSL